MTACGCAAMHARHIRLSPGIQHDPCSMKCPVCCEATWSRDPNHNVIPFRPADREDQR